MLRIKTKTRWKNIWRMIGIYNTHPVVWEKYVHIFPNIMYWLNMISCKRWGFSRIYCLHKEELSHLVSTYQYFSAMPWHNQTPGWLSAYRILLPWWLALLGLVVGLLLCKGGILGREFRGDGSSYPALAADRRPRHRGEFTRRGRDESPFNKQTQQGLRSLSLPYLESLSLFRFRRLPPSISLMSRTTVIGDNG